MHIHLQYRTIHSKCWPNTLNTLTLFNVYIINTNTTGNSFLQQSRKQKKTNTKFNKLNWTAVHTWKGSVNTCERVRLSSINSEKYFMSSCASTALVLGVLTPSNWSPRWTTFVATKLMRSSSALKWSNATCSTVAVLCRYHKWRSLITIYHTHTCTFTHTIPVL